MKAAREKKKQDEAEAEKRRAEKITGLANIESSIKKKHQQTKDSAAKPPASKITAKVPRTVSTSAMLASHTKIPDDFQATVEDNDQAATDQQALVSHSIYVPCLSGVNSPRSRLSMRI